MTRLRSFIFAALLLAPLAALHAAGTPFFWLGDPTKGFSNRVSRMRAGFLTNP